MTSYLSWRTALLKRLNPRGSGATPRFLSMRARFVLGDDARCICWAATISPTVLSVISPYLSKNSWR